MTRLRSKWTHSSTTFSGENQRRYGDLNIRGLYCSSEWKQGEGVGGDQ